MSPNSAHKIMINHSFGQTRADGIPGKYKIATPSDMITASQPIVVPPGSRKGRSMFGAFFRKIMNDIETISQAITSANPPAFTNQTRAGRPNSGASVYKAAMSKIAL